MIIYKVGSTGAEVTKIQNKLKELGFYKGIVDGAFGGGTEVAVRGYQQSAKLAVDGQVGPKTWTSLFEEKIIKPVVTKESLLHRCLALTGAFETGKMAPDCFAGLSGNFDGQGMSFGVLQWNFGQKSLQPLLIDMNNAHSDVLKNIFNKEYGTLVEILGKDYASQMKWVGTIQHPVKCFLYEPWCGYFKTLGRTEEFQEIETKYSTVIYQGAIGLCKEYNLLSERAVALMFDIKVQNGSINKTVKTIIQNDFSKISGLSGEALEVAKMRVVANRRAEAANSKWVEDVRSRKLCCANGEGVVHNISYSLSAQFGIRLCAFA
ncbi:MAG: peptidoglycan-binding domain-containing protein [bacterium]